MCTKGREAHILNQTNSKRLCDLRNRKPAPPASSPHSSPNYSICLDNVDGTKASNKMLTFLVKLSIS